MTIILPQIWGPHMICHARYFVATWAAAWGFQSLDNNIGALDQEAKFKAAPDEDVIYSSFRHRLHSTLLTSVLTIL